MNTNPEAETEIDCLATCLIGMNQSCMMAFYRNGLCSLGRKTLDIVSEPITTADVFVVKGEIKHKRIDTANWHSGVVKWRMPEWRAPFWRTS